MFGRERSDAELFERAVRGDEDAFAELYRRRQGGIYRFALQMSGSRELAEDVTQEVFIILARDASKYDPARASVSTFLYGIARNLVLRGLEWRGDATSLDEENGAEVAAAGRSPLEDLVHSEAVEVVRRAVLTLPPGYREAVVLCDLQELSYAEAADAMACRVGTVRSRLSRGRALLAEKLQAARRCYV